MTAIKTFTDDELLQGMREHVSSGLPILYRNYPQAKTAARRFGSWNQALILSGLPINHVRESRIETICANCHKAFSKRASAKAKTKNDFCGRSCSATFNNKLFPKRIKSTPLCISCGKHQVPTKRNKLCNECRLSPIDLRTLVEASYQNQTSGKFAAVRDRARLQYSQYLPLGCQHCGRKGHVDVCHITKISAFSPETQVRYINRRENIAILCKSCHWDLDHGEIISATLQSRW